MKDDRSMGREEFIAMLVRAGWTMDEARQEWDDIQNDSESEF